MPSSYTPSLRLTLPATGELTGTWGTTVNTGITELLDAAVAGTTTISTWGGAGVPYTLSNTDGAADEARRMFIVATGAPGEAKNVICPAVSKLYFFRNDTTGGFALTLKTSGGTGIAVPAGQYKMLYCDGTNVVEAVNSPGPVASLSASQAVFTDGSKNLVSNAVTGSGNVVMSASPTLTGTVAGASLQLSSLTSGRVTYAGASGLLQDSTNLTFDGTSLTLGGNPTLSAGTTNGVLYLNGSKVATSGSALTFDGSQVYIKPSSGFQPLKLAGSGGSIDTFFYTDTAYWGWSDAAALGGNAFAGHKTDNYLFWQIAGTERMRLTSTGLGIGTSSPGYKLDVTVTPANNDAGINITNTDSSGYGASYNFSHRLTAAGAIARRTYISSEGSASGSFMRFATTDSGGTLAERMRLDSSGNLGLGVAPSAWSTDYKPMQLGINGAVFGRVATLAHVGLSANAYRNAGGTWTYISTAAASLYNQDTGTHYWFTAPSGTAGNAITFTQAMLLDSSGNLGIGTSSPAYKFVVSNAGAQGLEVDPVGGINSGVTVIAYNRSTAAYITQANYALDHRWLAGIGVEAMRLDSSGNVGIGTSSPATKLHVDTGAAGYGLTLAASSLTARRFQFGIDGSANLAVYDTAAAAVRMTLDSSGNLGLGVTPSAWDTSIFRTLQLGTGAGSVSLSGRSDGTKDLVLGSNLYYGSGAFRYVGTGVATVYRTDGGVHSWGTAPSGTAGNAISFTEAMTLDASGNLGVGTTSPGYKVDVVGGIRATLSGQSQIWNGATGTYVSWQYNGTTVGDIGTADETFSGGSTSDFGVTSRAGNLVFGTNSTERARITSGGDFGIGNTNPLYRLTVDKDTTSALAFFTNSNASAPNGLYVDFSAASPNNATEYFLYCEDSTAQRATIRSNGGLANYSGNDVNLSDRREKTNFAPAKSYLDTICAIPVQTFNYIDQSQDDPGLTLGVVAQDVQAVAPELVMESNWGTEDEPKMRLSIYQTDLQYALMKCIQELKAQNDELRARVAALESQS